MLKHLPLALTASTIISMLAIASVSAVDEDSPTPTPSPEATADPSATPTPSPEPVESPTPTPLPSDAPSELDDEAEDEDAAAESGDPNKAAQAIADTFGVPVEEVMELHDQGIGFGALFKLYKLALARGVDIHDLVDEFEEDGGGWSFGKRFGELTEEEWANCEGLPKNLGQAISGHADEEEGDEVMSEGETDEDYQGEDGHGRGGKNKSSSNHRGGRHH